MILTWSQIWEPFNERLTNGSGWPELTSQLVNILKKLIVKNFKHIKKSVEYTNATQPSPSFNNYQLMGSCFIHLGLPLLLQECWVSGTWYFLRRHGCLAVSFSDVDSHCCSLPGSVISLGVAERWYSLIPSAVTSWHPSTMLWSIIWSPWGKVVHVYKVYKKRQGLIQLLRRWNVKYTGESMKFSWEK